MTYSQATFDFDDAISSEASAVGNSPCTSPGGESEASGPALAPVNPTRRRGSKKATRTTGTSGLKCFGSSASAALTQCLGSRLQTRLATVGSMEYRQTWNQKVTPSGRLYWAHTASAARISGSDCSGWPTPKANEKAQSPEAHAKGFYSLMEMAEMAAMAGWNTPRATDGTKGGPGQTGGALPAMAGWPSPTALSFAESHMPGNNRSMNKTLGVLPTSSPAETGRPAVLDAAFSRWLMGYPANWDQASPNWDAWQSVQERIALAASEGTGTP
jgi:hypothetical protein